MLKYVGRVNKKGERDFIPGVPPRDLTSKEVGEFDVDALIASGLYKKKPKAESNKKAAGASENKGA